MWTGICRLTDNQWRPAVRAGDVSRAMWLVRVLQLALLQGATGLRASVEGELALDVRVARGGGRWLQAAWPVASQTGSQAAHKLLFKIGPCVYQFPKKVHVNALLSNMMNELAKVFVRANKYMKGLKTQRGVNELKQENRKSFTRLGPVEPEKKEPVKERPRVKVSRFKVVHEKQKPFFERLFHNVTDEYRNFCKATFGRNHRMRGNRCSRQPELKQMWLQLLQRAQDALRTAAERLVHEYLAETPAENKAQVRKRLQQFLKPELAKVRANQLDMLCAVYQLCYPDLL